MYPTGSFMQNKMRGESSDICQKDEPVNEVKSLSSIIKSLSESRQIFESINSKPMAIDSAKKE